MNLKKVNCLRFLLYFITTMSLLAPNSVSAADSLITIKTTASVTVGSGADLCAGACDREGTGALNLTGTWCTGALLAYLTSFTTEVSENSIIIKWTTASEKDNAGFYLWRSENETEEYEVLNEYIIPSEGNEIIGAFYKYTDNAVSSGKTYYYKLEAVNYTGTSEWYYLDNENMININNDNLSGLNALNINNSTPTGFKNQVTKPDDKFETENNYDNKTQNNKTEFDNELEQDNENMNNTYENDINAINSYGCSCSILN